MVCGKAAQLFRWYQAELELDQVPEGSKQPLRQHLHQVWKVTKKKPEQLCVGELPEELEYLFEWHLEMRYWPNFSFAELKSWSDLTQRYLKPWEVELLTSLFNIWIRYRK